MDVKKHSMLNDAVLLAMVLCLIGSFFGTVFEVTRVTSLAFSLSLVLVLGFFAYRCFLNNRINLYLVIVLFLLVLSLLFGGLSGGLDYFKPAIIFVCSLACIALAYDVEISENAKKLMLLAGMAASVVIIVYFHFFGLKEEFYGSTDLVVLNFPNPNEAGMWIMSFIMLTVSGMRVFSGIVMKIASTAVAVFLIPLLMATKSRNAIIACAFFLVGFLAIRILKIRSAPKWAILAVTLSPFIVFSAYMLIHYVNPDTLDVVVGDDPSKTMSSRAGVWSRVMKNFGDSFLVGDYGEFADQNMHNSFASIFCQYGMPLLAAAAWFMYDAACRAQRRFSIYAALSLCAAYLSGRFETSFFCGISGLYLILFLLPACNGKGDRKEAAYAEQ